MNCNEHEPALLDIARGVMDDEVDRAAALDHVSRCRRCAAVLDDQRALSRGLRALAAGIAAPAPTALEGRLLARMGEGAVEEEAVWRAALKAAAAVILVAAALLVAWREFTTAPASAPARAHEFVLWPGAASLPPFESGELVRTELPVTALPALGLQPPAGASADTVTADLLIAQDGLVRAVRLAN